MRTARFFVPADWVALSAEAFCIPQGALHKQITLVLRLKAGDNISLMVNDGAEIDCRITEITRSAVMGVIAGSKISKPLLPNITVCAAFTKRDSFEWMLQKCTELGATAFVPMLTDRVIKRPKENPTRLNIILKEAAEQSGRTTIPSLVDPMNFGQAIGHTKGMARIIMHETDGKAWPTIHKTSSVALFIGPEGGFTDSEIELAAAAGAHITTLGELVLRAETAAIAGVSKLRFG